eukprot:Pgem_evm1s17785
MKNANLGMDITADKKESKIDLLNILVNEKGELLHNKNRPVNYLSVVDGSQKYIFMANHQAYADSFFVGYLLSSGNHADGSILWFIWKTFLVIPLGWASYMCGHCFLGFGKKDPQNLQDSCEKFNSMANRCYALYPEGAIKTKSVTEKTRKYAEREGLPIMKNVLLPRLLAITSCIKQMKKDGGKVIIDVTFGFPKDSPWKTSLYNILDIAKLHSKPVKICGHVRQFDLEDVGNSDEEIRDWIYERFQEKDQLLEVFEKEGKFPGTTNVLNCSPSYSILLRDSMIWWPCMALFSYGVFVLLSFLFWSVVSFCCVIATVSSPWISGVTMSAMSVLKINNSHSSATNFGS